jgi:Ca-activated chloride channel family protein
MDMSALSFDAPWWLWLLIPVLFWQHGVTAVRWQSLPQKRIRLSFVDALLPQPSVVGARHRLWLWRITGVWLVIVMAQPVWQTMTTQPAQSLTQANGVVVVETSVNGLLVESDGNSRLQQAQRWITQLLELRSEQSRTGLVVFADEAYPVLPLTQDKLVLQRMTERLQPALAGREDAGLLEAVQIAGWQAWQQSAGRPSWVALLTDGAHASVRGSLAEVMQWFEAHQVQLYVVMLGAAQAPPSSPSGLLYTPRNTAMSTELASYNVPVVMVESSDQVHAIIQQLTATQTVQHQSDAVVSEAYALSTPLLGMLLVIWSLMWWRGKA